MSNDKGIIATVEEYLNLTVDERKKALDEKRFVIPTKKSNPSEREKWDRLYHKTLEEPEKSATEASAESLAKPDDKPAPVSSATSKLAAAPGSATEASAAPRFKSLEEAEKALGEKEKLINNQQEIINKLNNTSSANGRQVKALQAQLAEVNEKIKNLPKPEQKIEEIDFPDPPEPPNPNKYEEDGGVNSEEYQKAKATYDSEQAAYFKKFKPLIKSISEIRKENQELKVQVEDFKKFKDTSLTREAETMAQQKASEVDTVTDELQKELGLTTSVPWRMINGQLTVLRDSADLAVKEATKAWYGALPESDKTNFGKLAKAVGFAFDFSEGVPRKVADIKSNRFRGTLLDEGFEFAKQPQSQSDIDLEAIRLKQASRGVSGIPASSMGADENLRTYNSLEEKKKRYSELQGIWRGQQDSNDFTSFRKGPFFKEYMELKRELGGILAE